MRELDQLDSTDASPTELSIAEIVSRSATSVRLSNAICNAEQSGYLPFRTVRDYMAAGTAAIPTMLAHVRNFGLKSARELDVLVRDVSAGGFEPEVVPSPEVGVTVEDLMEVFGEVSVNEAFSEEVPSVRLANALRRSGIGVEPLAAYLAKRGAFTARLLREANVGRTSVAEMGYLAVKVARRRLRAAGVEADEIVRLLNGEGALAGLVDLEEKIPVPEDLRGCAAWVLSNLTDRDAEVLRLRFGLEGRPQETLEEVGRRYAITRERIRQIEARALKTGSAVARRLPLDEALGFAWKREWERLTGGTGYLTDDAATHALHSIDPDLTMLTSIRSESRRSGLGRVAERRPHGWIGSPLSEEQVDLAAVNLQRNEGSPLPRPIDAGDGGSEIASAAAAVVLGLATYRGYLIPRRGAVRVRRAVDLHSLLAGAKGVLSVPSLAGLHLVSEPADPCSVRDALFVMDAAPHLFIEVCEDAWCAVGSQAAGRALTAQRTTGPVPPGDPGEGTIAHALVVALTSRGPERLHTLYKEASQILPPGRSPNSVGPVLISRPDLFERALPGVYGLTGALPDPARLHEAPPHYLLEEQQLRLYALARRSGEPMDIFPLWSPSAEYALARWGRSSARPESFRSLLAVADVSAWPVSEEARYAWSQVIANERRFELSCECRAGDFVLPEPERLLAAALLARHQGVLGWMAINRVCQRRLDAFSAAGTLALMLRSGILVTALQGGNWQCAHLPGGALDRIIAALSDELGNKGHLDWRSGSAAAVLEALHEPAGFDWIDEEAFQAMLSETRTRVPELERLMADRLEHLLEPEAPGVGLLEEEPSRMSIDRGDEMMSWLLKA